MLEPLQIGVIGAGWYASRRHIPDILTHPDARLAALCRRDPQALDLMAQEFGPCATYSDYHDLLAHKPLDGVVISTPHDVHYEQAMAAIDAGLHLLVEKPLTIRPEHAHALLEAAKERGLVLHIPLNPPHMAHCRRMREVLMGKELGELEAASMFWTGNARYAFGDGPMPDNLPGVTPPTLFRADAERCGGGYLIDGGSHLISEMLWVTGLRVLEVSCVMDRTPSDRRAQLTLRFENGALGSITCIGDSSERRVRNVFACNRGMTTVDSFAFQTTIHREIAQSESFTEAELDPSLGPVATWLDAIRNPLSVKTTAELAAHVVEVVWAAYRSAESGRVVGVGETQV